jgi:hypothetical protein
VATKKGSTTNFFSSFSFVAVFGSGIRDLRSGIDKNQDPGYGINTPDPQHCWLVRYIWRSVVDRHRSVSHFSFWCRFRSESRSGPFPQVLHMLENQNIFAYFHSQQCQFTLFYLSRQCLSCHNFVVFWTVYWNFLYKKYSFFSFGWNEYRSGSDKMMPVRPDPDPQRGINILLNLGDW